MLRVDATMPRDTARYRREEGYAAVVAVGFDEEPDVFRVAAAENVDDHLAKIQPGRWQRVYFGRVIWTPGLAVSRTLVEAAERFMTANGWSLGQHWFRAPIDVFDDLIRAEAIRLNAPLWSHEQLAEILKRKARQRADRIVARL